MEHPQHESKWHLYEIESHFAFLQAETDKCTGIYGSYFMNTISRGIINLHWPQQPMAALKEIYLCGTSTETTSKQITPLIEKRKSDFKLT